MLTSGFGIEDMNIIYDKHPSLSNSNLGGAYELPPGITHNTEQSKSYLAGSYYFKVKEFEVYLLKYL